MHTIEKQSPLSAAIITAQKEKISREVCYKMKPSQILQDENYLSLFTKNLNHVYN